MALSKQRIHYLWQQYAAKKATEAEVEELFAVLDEAEGDVESRVFLQGLLEKTEALGSLDEKRWEPVLKRILDSEKQLPSIGTPKIVWIRRIAVAASIILIAALAITLSLPKRNSIDSGQVVQTTNDVEAPKETRAVITLANGDKIYLDSAGTGTLIKQDGVEVIKNNEGEINYRIQEAGHREGEVVYNTLSNPRGSKVISLTLSDGTKVWLNSESSLKYPTAFTGNTREVEITGEAYFEVAHIEKGSSIARPFKAGKNGTQKTKGFSPMPFFVKSGNVTTEVLGTHFNVNSYTDEGGVKVTLLEGSVKVSRGSQSAIIKPGEQAIAVSSPAGGGREGALQTTNSIDLEEVMAWKNGRFLFHSVDLPYILRQAQRWYDVDVVYQKNIDKRFNGEFDRNTNLSNLLKALELSGGVQFEVKGKTIIVK